MDLAYHKLGNGRSLIVLHGLYGSSDNWHTIGRELSKYFEVYLVDQRNHGNSPHHPLHNYEAMCDDLYEFCLKHHIDQTILLGHSMGGKTAMSFVLKHEKMVDKLMVVDISPADYRNNRNEQFNAVHSNIISSMQLIDPSLIHNHDEADQILQNSIPQDRIRRFLLKNLKRKKEGGYRWAFNLESLSQHLDDISAGILPYNSRQALSASVPALFLKGEFSNYITTEDEAFIKKIFPSSRVVQISGAGHWIHSEQPSAFLKSILEFLL